MARVSPVQVPGNPVHRQPIRGCQLLLYDGLGELAAVEWRTSEDESEVWLNVNVY